MKDHSYPFREIHIPADRPEVEVSAAWDEGNFFVVVRGEANRKHLRDIYDALLNKDAVIAMGGNANPFANSGLVISIYSRLPKEFLDRQIEADSDHYKLVKAAKKTGIVQRVDDYNKKWQKDNPGRYFGSPKGYYSLSPSWISDEKKSKSKTKYSVIFWLNPQQQDINNFGWFTVEELDSWLAGDSDCPIMKKKDEK